jgi:hypothetical protein
MTSIPIIRSASNIVLYGGLLRLADPTIKFMAANIALGRSNAWLGGSLILNKKNYYRVLPSRDNYIEIKHIRNNYFLAVNEHVIYQKEYIFGYKIDVKLNKAITDQPYADFFKYY